MTDTSRTSTTTIWRGYLLPILFVAGVAAIVAYPIGEQFDLSFPVSFAIVLAICLGGLAVLNFMSKAYEATAGRLGWRCEVTPGQRPPSAQVPVDLVMRGEMCGQPFTLYRERSRRGDRPSSTWSGLEWVDDRQRLPTFVLSVSGAVEAAVENTLGATRLMHALTDAFGMYEDLPRVTFDGESRLARRCTLRAQQADAVRALFTPGMCEALDPLVKEGAVEARGGLLVIREHGFPGPSGLEPLVKRGEEIRRLIMG
jgi:hypothetical protein